jgi:FkbM family methyltransferase
MSDLVSELLPTFHLDQKSVVFDLGANRGDFSVFAAQYSATVFAFEPNGHAFRYLARRISKFNNVNALKVAVSDKTGISEYFDHPDAKLDPLGYSIRGSLLRKEPEFQADPMKVLTLDFEKILNGFSYISCLKVDIEGSEQFIWPALRDNHTKIEYLLMEVHDSLNINLRAEIDSFISKNQLEERWTTRWK